MLSIYFLDRDSIVRARKNANQLLTENETSAVNQAVAFYRQSGGISTEQEPLAAQESLALAGSAIRVLSSECIFFRGSGIGGRDNNPGSESSRFGTMRAELWLSDICAAQENCKIEASLFWQK